MEGKVRSIPATARDDRSVAQKVDDLRDRVIVALEMRASGHLTAAKVFAALCAIECRRARNGLKPDPEQVIQAAFATLVPLELR